MKIKIQKIISFIPILNFFVMIVWFFKTKIDTRDILMLGISAIVIEIPRIIIHKLFGIEILDDILFYIAIYLHGLAVAWIAIYDQEKAEKKHGGK